MLIRSAHSANIKERQDCSTALFDTAGELVMQAEHIPVHLGSMPAAVEAVLGERHEPGRMWILNDPFAGGTHLPDITLISPVFERGGELIGFAASRAHHADVGGPTPGGMPARLAHLDEEGVVIPPTRVEDGTLEELAERMRNPGQRLADLRAQRAANALGAERLAALAADLGTAGAARGHGRGPRLRRAAHPRGARPTSATAPARRPTGSSARSRREGEIELRVDARDRGRGARRSTSPAPPRRYPATSTARCR